MNKIHNAFHAYRPASVCVRASLLLELPEWLDSGCRLGFALVSICEPRLQEICSVREGDVQQLREARFWRNCVNKRELILKSAVFVTHNAQRS